MGDLWIYLHIYSGGYLERIAQENKLAIALQGVPNQLGDDEELLSV